MIPDSRLHDLLRQQGHDPGFDRPVERPRKKRDNREHRIQAACVRWWQHAAAGFGVDARLLYAVPNGALYGKGVERVIRAKILKAEGLRVGWPDIGIDVPRRGYHGLRVELKVPGAEPSADQFAIHDLLREQGYWVGVAHSVGEFAGSVTEYFKP